MPWDASRAGFAMTSKRSDPTRKMALHPDKEQYALAVENQGDKTSVLAETKRLIVERKNGIFDRYGDIKFLPQTTDKVIAYVRTAIESYECMLCLYNFSDEEISINYLGEVYKLEAESYRHIRISK
jgi:glycosidase